MDARSVANAGCLVKKLHAPATTLAVAKAAEADTAQDVAYAKAPSNHSGRHKSCGDPDRTSRQPYSAPKFAQARKSAPSGSAVPNACQALGRKIASGATLCMNTGIRNSDASVSRSAPICP